jgi:hypothetical protein
MRARIDVGCNRFKKRKAEEEAERTSHALAKAAKLPVENDDDVFG